MASRLFARAATRRYVVSGGATLGVAATLLATKQDVQAEGVTITPAEEQYLTSYGYYSPVGKGTGLPYSIAAPKDRGPPYFQIRNDYPKSSDFETSATPSIPDRGVPGDFLSDEAPWLKYCFKTDPQKYCEVIKEYCWEGNVNHEFKIENNSIRDWYHAPWMHYNQNGREPVSGLTFERPTPAGELAKTQTRILQCWAIGFYNKIGATVFGDVWQDPNNPDWNKSVMFPKGTCVFKILLTDAKNEELPFMDGSPSLPAVIAEQPTAEFLAKSQGSAPPRNNFTSSVRLVQVDFAVRDDRADIGWVFGTFMYDSAVKAANPWDRIIPVGLQWGNDPDLTQEAYDKGARPEQTWINPVADALREELGGVRAVKGWGWNGRMNGPADNFKSACASCHSTSQKNDAASMIPSGTDAEKMKWFRNIKPGEPFTDGDISGDYSLQLMMGYKNYQAWAAGQPKPLVSRLWYSTKYAIPFSKTRQEANAIEAKRGNLRD